MSSEQVDNVVTEVLLLRRPQGLIQGIKRMSVFLVLSSVSLAANCFSEKSSLIVN